MKLSTRQSLVIWILFGLALNISISVAQIIAGGLLLAWLANCAKKNSRKAWRKSTLDVPIAVFIGWGILSAVIHQSTGIRDSLSDFTSFLLFFWAVQSLEADDINPLFLSIGAGAAFVGLWGILQVLGQVYYLPVTREYVIPDMMASWPRWLVKELAVNNERAQGFRNHPLTYAESLIPGFFIVLTAFFQGVRDKKKNWLILMLLFVSLLSLAGGLILAQGRAVWGGVGLGVLVCSWMVGRRFFFQSAAVLVVALSILLMVSPKLGGRLLSVFSSSSGSLGDQYSKSTRLTLWKESLEGIKAHPLLGVGSDGVALESIDPISHEKRVWSETHNMFLQIALELGIVGLGFFCWILAALAWVIWKMKGPWRPAFGGMFAAFLVAGLTESWTGDKEVSMLFWLMMGSAVFLAHEKA